MTNKLITMLKEIEEGVRQYTHQEYDARYIEVDSDVINEIDSVLITSDGQCNWDNIRALEKAGYHVYAGEKDSFGWLTGCIRTSKGVIVYG